MLIVSIILEAAITAIAILAARDGRPYLYGLAVTFGIYVLYDLARLLGRDVEGPLVVRAVPDCERERPVRRVEAVPGSAAVNRRWNWRRPVSGGPPPAAGTNRLAAAYPRRAQSRRLL